LSFLVVVELRCAPDPLPKVRRRPWLVNGHGKPSGTRPPHRWAADWNWGELGSTFEGNDSEPFALADIRMPCFVMHAANLASPRRFAGLVTCVAPPCGSKLAHARFADWNCGEPGLTPGGTISVPFRGSGKLDTP
jgi:hypothetical protein